MVVTFDLAFIDEFSENGQILSCNAVSVALPRLKQKRSFID